MTKTTRNEQGFIHIWAPITLLVVLGGITYAAIKMGSHPAQNKPLTTNISGLLTADKIKKIASQDAPKTEVSQIGLVQTSSGPVFHVQLADGSSLDLNATSGAKVSHAEVSDDSEGTKIPSGFTPTIDFNKAEQIAQGQITQGSIVRVELETEDGTTVYRVQFSTGAKVLVNATTGSVVKVEASKAQGKQPASTSGSGSNETEGTTSGSGSSKSSGESSGSSESGSSSGPNSSGSTSGSSQSGDSQSGSSTSGSGSGTSGSGSSGGSGDSSNSGSGGSGSGDSGSGGSGSDDGGSGGGTSGGH